MKPSSSFEGKSYLFADTAMEFNNVKASRMTEGSNVGNARTSTDTKAILAFTNMLDFVLPLKLRRNWSVSWKTREDYKQNDKDSLLDVANKTFYCITKNDNFMLLETVRRALTGRNIKVTVYFQGCLAYK